MTERDAKPFNMPVWAVVLAVGTALTLPIALGGVWPNGAFFAGLMPAVFLLALYHTSRHELRERPGSLMPEDRYERLRGAAGWRRAWVRATVAASIALALAIFSDWWAIRLG